MKRYIPHIIISLLIFIVFMQCNQLKKQDSKLQSINDDLIRSKTREGMYQGKLEELQKQEKEITVDTTKMNNKHEEIRNNIITPAISDSLLWTVIINGEERFGKPSP